MGCSMNNGKWNIIIRTQGKNNDTELKNALYSVIIQSYQKKSIIIIIHSNESKVIQETQKFLEHFESLIPMKIVVARKKQGIRSYPLNVALKYLDGEFVSFLDHDDIYYPYMGTILINHLKNEKKSFAYGRSVKVLQEELKDQWGYRYLYTKDKNIFETKNFNLISFFLDNYIPFNTFILRTSLIGDAKFNENLDYLEDWDFLRRLFLKKNFSLFQSKLPVSEYRLRNDQTDSHNQKTIKRWNEARKITDKNIENEELVLEIKTIEKFGKEYYKKVNTLVDEISKIRMNPGYRLWIFIKDIEIIDKTAGRLIRYLRGKFIQK